MKKIVTRFVFILSHVWHGGGGGVVGMELTTQNCCAKGCTEMNGCNFCIERVFFNPPASYQQKQRKPES